MSDETERASIGATSREAGLRKRWHRPQLAVLPVDQTAGSHQPGGDGGGPDSDQSVPAS